MENCKLLHDNVFSYVENKLPPTLTQQLDAHVYNCAECAALVAEFKSVMIFIDENKSVGLTPFAETRILQGIQSRLEKKQKSSILMRTLQPAFVSMGIIIAVAVGFLIGSDFAGTNIQYSQNEEMTENVRIDLNVPEFMTDDIFYFSE